MSNSDSVNLMKAGAAMMRDASVGNSQSWQFVKAGVPGAGFTLEVVTSMVRNESERGLMGMTEGLSGSISVERDALQSALGSTGEIRAMVKGWTARNPEGDEYAIHLADIGAVTVKLYLREKTR